jgi:hypothetical protein
MEIKTNRNNSLIFFGKLYKSFDCKMLLTKNLPKKFLQPIFLDSQEFVTDT